MNIFQMGIKVYNLCHAFSKYVVVGFQYETEKYLEIVGKIYCVFGYFVSVRS